MYVRMRRAQEPVRYQTVASRRGDLAVTVTATGTLAALDTVDVGTEVSGVVDVVMADYNDRVRKGQTLAVVNTDQLQAQIQQGEAAQQQGLAGAGRAAQGQRLARHDVESNVPPQPSVADAAPQGLGTEQGHSFCAGDLFDC
jgi:HlyD family secretion protein